MDWEVLVILALGLLFVISGLCIAIKKAVNSFHKGWFISFFFINATCFFFFPFVTENIQSVIILLLFISIYSTTLVHEKREKPTKKLTTTVTINM